VQVLHHEHDGPLGGQALQQPDQRGEQPALVAGLRLLRHGLGGDEARERTVAEAVGQRVQGLRDRGVRREPAAGLAVPPQHRGAPGDAGEELPHQPRLADAGLAAEEDATRCGVVGGPEKGELGHPPDERRAGDTPPDHTDERNAHSRRLCRRSTTLWPPDGVKGAREGTHRERRGGQCRRAHVGGTSP
jgi:hypothetical protein